MCLQRSKTVSKKAKTKSYKEANDNTKLRNDFGERRQLTEELNKRQRLTEVLGKKTATRRGVTQTI